MKIQNRVGREYNDYCIICGNPNIEKDVWIGYFTLIDGSGGLRIGEGSTISSGVHIYTHDSIKRTLYRIPQDFDNYFHVDRAEVRIGQNVFIGANSTILRGVTIGDQAIIGANTLVNRDVPGCCKAFGNPMRIEEFLP